MVRKVGFTGIGILVAAMGFAVTAALCSKAPIGSLVGSTNATLDGQAPLPHTAMLSGDNLQVNDGVAVVTLNQGNRMILGRDTQASFSQGGDGVTISLAQGAMSLYHPGKSGTFHVKVGDVTVAPATGSRTLGEIAMVNGQLLVAAKDGTLQVEKAGTTQEVRKGKTITIAEPVASAPMPMPQGKRHIKRIFRVSPAALLALGIAGEVAGTAFVIATLSSTAPVVSPTKP